MVRDNVGTSKFFFVNKVLFQCYCMIHCLYLRNGKYILVGQITFLHFHHFLLRYHTDHNHVVYSLLNSKLEKNAKSSLCIHQYILNFCILQIALFCCTYYILYNGLYLNIIFCFIVYTLKYIYITFL